MKKQQEANKQSHKAICSEQQQKMSNPEQRQTSYSNQISPLGSEKFLT